MALAGIGDRVEGLHAVAAAAASGRVNHLHVERTRLRHDAIESIVATVREGGGTVVVEDDVRPMASTAAPQGLVAEATPIALADIDELVELTTPAALVVLDHLEDPRNIGAIARSAWAAGIGALVVPRHRTAPLGATAFKAAAGALEHVRVGEVGSVPDALRRLSARSVWTVGLDGSAERPLWDLELFTDPVAVVIGAEGRGLHRLTAERCDVLVRIPMAPGVESLNASVAAALAVFEIVRMRR
jgi:23S rRNA (guanosine2251-2'-O)-methyltransferase